ncbi:hypothetical protein PoB_006941500 [Plakobranchus ocellatus]|uniref:Uncharacterized protein n=1 Tax=Plakobranchus ocellatus TaxID=259542 RepID=A0AAV4DFN7_9GAST|nr:hypothetical protein PoB_006941500 [Plakobranchus ocellatus]
MTIWEVTDPFFIREPLRSNPHRRHLESIFCDRRHLETYTRCSSTLPLLRLTQQMTEDLSDTYTLTSLKPDRSTENVWPKDSQGNEGFGIAWSAASIRN